MSADLNKVNSQAEVAVEEPIVYAIQKDLKGWKFSRRAFLKGAVATAEVAVAAGAIAGCGSPATPEAAVATATAAPEAATEAPPTATSVPPTDTPEPTRPPTKTLTKTPTKTPTKKPTPTPTPYPRAIVNREAMNVRAGPGTDYDIVGAAKQDEEYVIIGRLADNSWYQIDYQEQVGWLAGSLVTAENAELAPVITDIPPTNTPAATPTPTETPTSTPMPAVEGTVQPGLTGINYTATDAQGVTRTYTLPCGSPLPPGAVCVCNCVTAPTCSCVGHQICTCDRVCTCNPQGGSYWYPN